jgi:hypothetical protein
MAEIQLKLAETEVQKGNLSGVVSALTEGLAIEKLQCVQYHFAYRVINKYNHTVDCYFDVMWHH